MNKPTLKLRLDAFPYETNTLFSLLILATIMQAVILGNALLLLFGVGSLDSLDPAAQGNQMTMAFLPIIGISLIVLLVVFGTAFIFYLRHPSRIRLRKKISSLTEKEQTLKDQVARLAEQAKIPMPQIEMDHPSGRAGTGGQAFGVHAPYSLRLDGGLRTWSRYKKDMFKAVVLHELAHISNQDITRSYYSEGIWRSVLLFLAIPFLFVIASFPGRALFFGIVERNLWARLVDSLTVAAPLFFEVGVMMIVTFLIWARLLRTREYYADWQAAIWGAADGLRRIFREQVENGRDAKPAFALSRLHPTAQERLDVLDHPERLFKVSKVFSILVGVLLAFMLSGLLYFSFSLFVVVQEYIQMYLPRFVWFVVFISFVLLMVLFIAWMISGTLGVQIQKQAMLDLTSGQRGYIRYFKMFWSALSFSIGMELGFLVAPFGWMAPQDLSAWLFEIFLGFPMLVLITWLYFAYVGFVSIRVYGGSVGRKRPKKSSLLVIVLTMIWLMFLFVPQLLAAKFSTGSNFDILTPIYFIVLGGTLMLSVGFIGITWIIINLSAPKHSTACPVCGEYGSGTISAMTICKKCNSPFGSWLLDE